MTCGTGRGDDWLTAEELRAEYGPGVQFSRVLTTTANARFYLEGIITAPAAAVEDVLETCTAPPPLPHPTSTFHQHARSHPDLAANSHILYSDGGARRNGPCGGGITLGRGGGTI